MVVSCLCYLTKQNGEKRHREINKNDLHRRCQVEFRIRSAACHTDGYENHITVYKNFDICIIIRLSEPVFFATNKEIFLVYNLSQ